MLTEIRSSDSREALRIMQILAVKTYRGPRLYNHLPMIQIQLDLGSLELWPTDKLEGFAEALVHCLPGLRDHGCS